MTDVIQRDAIAEAIINGNVAGLTPEQKVGHQKAVSEAMGLNPLTSGLQYTKLQGREVLYASKQTAEQLRRQHKVSITNVHKEKMGDLLVVTVAAQTPDGRQDTSIAALDLAGLSGERLANALMKAETKAKRRVTLSICGLGMLDESEVESVHAIEAQALPEPEPQREGPFYYSFAEVLDDEERKALQTRIKKHSARLDREKKLWVTLAEVPGLSEYEVGEPGDED